jgi:polysaccharide export outer membrane protein
MGARFDLTDIRSGTTPDPQILPGDVVVVGFSQVRGIYRDILDAAPLFNIFTRF